MVIMPIIPTELPGQVGEVCGQVWSEPASRSA